MSQLLFDNPVLVKHVRSRLRRPQAEYLVLVVFVICCCVIWAAFAGMGFDIGFLVFFYFQVAMLYLAGMSQVASSIGQVNESGVLDFHRISPLPPSATALGFILGAPIREYLVAAVILPFALFAAVQGKLGFFDFVKVLLVLLSSTWLFHLLAMTAGLVRSRGKSRGTNLGVGALVVLSWFSASLVPFGLPIPGLLTALPALNEAMQSFPQTFVANWQINLPTFFGFELPLFLQSLCYQLPLIAFLAVPVVRCMRSAEASLYSKSSAIGFLVTISLLSVGGIIGHRKIEAQWIIPFLLYLNGAFSMLLTMAVTPNQGAFLNHLRRSNKQGQMRPSVWTDNSSNRAAVLIMCLLTYAMVQGIEWFANVAEGGLGKFNFLVPSITTLATIAYFGFAAQFFGIRSSRPGNATLVVFLFFVWVLPLIAGYLCAMTFGQATAEFVYEVSPILGIAKKSIISMGVSCGLACLFFVTLLREESRQWAKIRNAALAENVTAAQKP